jgi:hypothetical protein
MACVVIVGVDVGSVRRKGGFSWASSDERIGGEDDPGELGRFLATALGDGQKVALALECPLVVPVPGIEAEQWQDLGRARQGDGNRSWSAGAGAGSMATGLVQLAWLCRYLAAHGSPVIRATTQLRTFTTGNANLLIAEAMVTSDGKPVPVDGLQDHADAVAAAKRLAAILDDEHGPASDVHCTPHSALNLAAAACLHAGLAIDPAELRQDITVAKARPQLSGSHP